MFRSPLSTIIYMWLFWSALSSVVLRMSLLFSLK